MGKEMRHQIKKGTRITKEQIAMIRSARKLEPEFDDDLPEIHPVLTPELYTAMMEAAAERNRRMNLLAEERL